MSAHIVPMPDRKVAPGKRVTVNFVLTDETGEILDDLYEATPFQFVAGRDEHLPPGLEQGLRGLSPGDEKTFEVGPDRAFGERDTTLMIRVRIDELPDPPPEVGDCYRPLAEGERGPMYTVTGFVEDWVTLDANHPWAGRTITYQVRVLDVDTP